MERYSVYKLTRNPSVDTPKTDILVGRVAEMEQLENAILRLLVGGSGIIRLTGEAGIGKTYLLRFLRKRCNLFLPLNRNCGENDCGQNAEAKSLIWLQGKANPGESYQPIREAIQSHFDFETADELKEHLASLGLENALPYFAELLHLPFESSNKKFNALTVEQIHHNAFQYLRDWLIKLAEDAPVVWVVDDTHWLSPESSRMLQYLCRTTKDSPVLFLFSRRSGYEQVPEAEYGIELEKQVAQRYPEVYQQIDLEPLREWAGLSLLSHFLGEQQLLPSKSDRILELAGGNPFYLREVAQLLIDAPDSLNVPLGIERLILAHLDLLPSVHQNLLRYASVLGSHVDMALLQAEFPEIELSKMFEQLQGIGWLQPAKEKRKPISLVWRHDLYRESIYNSVEPNARRQLHEEIAQQLEGNPETSPNLLTDHYEAAGKLEKAAHYASLAVAMHHEQQRHLRVQRYAEMALSHPETLSQEQHVEIHYQYARALGATGHSSEAVLHLEQALNLANTNSQRILINIQLAEYHHNQHGVALREKALSLIDESTETSVIIEACSILPRTALTPSTNPDVVRQVLHLTQKRKKRKAEVLALRLLALAQAAAGNLDDAQSSIQQAIQLAKELEDNDLLAAMEFGYAILLWEGSRSSDALNHLHRALHLWEQMEKYPYHALHLLGCIYHSLGQYESMTEVFERILERRELLGEASLNIRDALSHLVEGHAWLGNWEKAYHYFWQMLDNVDSGASDSLFDVEAAIGTLCHGIKDYRRWMWKGIPQTMARAQELIRRLYEHGISPEDKRLERVFHPILAAGYVEYAIKSRNSLPRSHEEGVAMMRLFARQVWILDEHVEFWAYLTGVLNYDRLEAIFEDALAQVDREEPILPNETRDRPEFFHATKPEKLILEWLRACLRERYETDDAGKHLRKLGIIPEPCWLVTGTFEENVPAEVEQEILDVVFNPDNKSRTGSLPVLSRAGSLPVKIEWRAPDDFRDGYIDCRHIF
ncbi:MAG: AAA family ATPase, partial [Deltaproteobacteria bacterium]|nr:AAA family ATPase [Deltaproteobacteria bacterium]